MARYGLRPSAFIGNPNFAKPEDYDLMEVIIVNLSDFPDGENNMLSFLSAIFSSELDEAKKKYYLTHNDAGLVFAPDEREVMSMCNYSEHIRESAWEKGVAAGKLEGIAEGEARGEARGLFDGMNCLQWLFTSGRTADAQQAIANPDFLRTCLAEYREKHKN